MAEIKAHLKTNKPSGSSACSLTEGKENAKAAKGADPKATKSGSKGKSAEMADSV